MSWGCMTGLQPNLVQYFLGKYVSTSPFVDAFVIQVIYIQFEMTDTSTVTAVHEDGNWSVMKPIIQDATTEGNRLRSLS